MRTRCAGRAPRSSWSHHPEGDLKKVSQGSVSRYSRRSAGRTARPALQRGQVLLGHHGARQQRRGTLHLRRLAVPLARRALRRRRGVRLAAHAHSDWYSQFDKAYPPLRRTSAPDVPAVDYTDLWWNPNESGWGLNIVQHASQPTSSRVWYTYDAERQAHLVHDSRRQLDLSHDVHRQRVRDHRARRRASATFNAIERERAPGGHRHAHVHRRQQRHLHVHRRRRVRPKTITRQPSTEPSPTGSRASRRHVTGRTSSRASSSAPSASLAAAVRTRARRGARLASASLYVVDNGPADALGPIAAGGAVPSRARGHARDPPRPRQRGLRPREQPRAAAARFRRAPRDESRRRARARRARGGHRGAARRCDGVGAVAPAVRGPAGERQYLCKRYPSVWVLFLRGFAPRVRCARASPPRSIATRCATCPPIAPFARCRSRAAASCCMRTRALQARWADSIRASSCTSRTTT